MVTDSQMLGLENCCRAMGCTGGYLASSTSALSIGSLLTAMLESWLGGTILGRENAASLQTQATTLFLATDGRCGEPQVQVN
jgi:hypothetical protein